MTVKDLYDFMSEQMPDSLREPWDNDGIMCCTDLNAAVRHALVTLDVTEEIVDYAIENNIDLIVSHHPLLFKPVCAVVEDEPTSRKLIKLINHDITVFSFHTRADKVDGGVNDLLAEILELRDVRPFGEGGLGRIGVLEEEATFEDFAYLVKDALNANGILVSDGYNTVSRVAVVGGEGKDYVRAALECGADTFVSGRIGYHFMEDAPELGLNMIEGGHFYTENPIADFFSSLIRHADPEIMISSVNSNLLKLL